MFVLIQRWKINFITTIKYVRFTRNVQWLIFIIAVFSRMTMVFGMMAAVFVMMVAMRVMVYRSHFSVFFAKVITIVIFHCGQW